MTATRRTLYCHCAYAKVVPEETKNEVLRRLGASSCDFEAVPDLCEMSARKDPALAGYAADPGLRIVACFPRAVQWLFHAAGHELSPEVSVANMREATPDEIERSLENRAAVEERA